MDCSVVPDIDPNKSPVLFADVHLRFLVLNGVIVWIPFVGPFSQDKKRGVSDLCTSSCLLENIYKSESINAWTKVTVVD
jgi:hypothetical protein